MFLEHWRKSNFLSLLNGNHLITHPLMAKQLQVALLIQAKCHFEVNMKGGFASICGGYPLSFQGFVLFTTEKVQNGS